MELTQTKIELLRQQAMYDFNSLKPSQKDIKDLIEFWCELLVMHAISDHRRFGDHVN